MLGKSRACVCVYVCMYECMRGRKWSINVEQRCQLLIFTYTHAHTHTGSSEGPARGGGGGRATVITERAWNASTMGALPTDLEGLSKGVCMCVCVCVCVYKRETRTLKYS